MSNEQEFHDSEYEEEARALAQHLDVPVGEVEHGEGAAAWTHGSTEWLVLDEDDADRAVREEIERDLWMFSARWLVKRGHLTAALTMQQVEAIQGALYEDANEVIRALVKDMDALVIDAVAEDGRGHFLASYDHEEHEVMLDTGTPRMRWSQAEGWHEVQGEGHTVRYLLYRIN
jgi:hypothetical protein